MASVVIAVGSNLGDREDYLNQAGTFLSDLSDTKIRKSSIWESEPVGPARFTFLNSVAIIETKQSPEELLSALKKFEVHLGRIEQDKKWGPRILDLDIICYDDLVIQSDNLIIPHPEYKTRLFVLLPMLELVPDWTDPSTGTPIEMMIEKAPIINIHKTEYPW